MTFVISLVGLVEFFFSILQNCQTYLYIKTYCVKEKKLSIVFQGLILDSCWRQPFYFV